MGLPHASSFSPLSSVSRSLRVGNQHTLLPGKTAATPPRNNSKQQRQQHLELHSFAPPADGEGLLKRSALTAARFESVPYALQSAVVDRGPAQLLATIPSARSSPGNDGSDEKCSVWRRGKLHRRMTGSEGGGQFLGCFSNTGLQPRECPEFPPRQHHPQRKTILAQVLTKTRREHVVCSLRTAADTAGMFSGAQCVAWIITGDTRHGRRRGRMGIAIHAGTSDEANNNNNKSPQEQRPKQEIHGRRTRAGRPRSQGPHNNIMIQGFNWESHKGSKDGKTWWQVLKSQVEELRTLGVTDIWLPPVSQAVDRQGYLPSELYNLDASRYGTGVQLKELIDELHNNGICVIADIVINHRSGGLQDNKGHWNIFKGGNRDKRLDWGPWAVVDDDVYDSGGKGQHDTGESYAAAPDLDHTNKQVQDELTDWMNWLKAEIGFDGWRFDFVKGYGPGYTKLYVAYSNPLYEILFENQPDHCCRRAVDINGLLRWSTFLGSEYLSNLYRHCDRRILKRCSFVNVRFWYRHSFHHLDNGVSTSYHVFGGTSYQLLTVQDGHRQKLCNWIDGTGGACSAFDFTTKGILQRAVENELWRLRDGAGKPPGLIGWWSERAVTFLDNHDTGSTQRHWPFPDKKISLGYAYILTHPGIPCIFYDHIYDYKLKNEIKQLLDLRKRHRINATSQVNIQKAEADIYIGKIDNRVILKMGPRYDMGSLLPGKDSWKLTITGPGYAIWESTAPLPSLPVPPVRPDDDDQTKPNHPTQPIHITSKMSEETRNRILKEVPQLLDPTLVTEKKTIRCLEDLVLKQDKAETPLSGVPASNKAANELQVEAPFKDAKTGGGAEKSQTPLPGLIASKGKAGKEPGVVTPVDNAKSGSGTEKPLTPLPGVIPGKGKSRKEPGDEASVVNAKGGSGTENPQTPLSGVIPSKGKARKDNGVAAPPGNDKSGSGTEKAQTPQPGTPEPAALITQPNINKVNESDKCMMTSCPEMLMSKAQTDPGPAVPAQRIDAKMGVGAGKPYGDEKLHRDKNVRAEVHGRRIRPGRPTPHGPYNNILLQGFNWESPNKTKDGQSWWAVLKPKVKDFVALGITDVWLPPPSHSVDKNGYLPSELYNLDASNYGTGAELKELIDELHLCGICAMADIVINHRCGRLQDDTGRWNNFKGGNQDKRLDWGPWAVVDDGLYDCGGKGTHDTGENYPAAPDLDHTNKQVQDELTDWMNWLKAEIGFDGWRFDFVKGYDPKFTSLYCARTNPTISVGELWTSMAYFNGQLEADQNGHRQHLCNWIDGTKGASCVFDFTTKGILQQAVKNELWRLKDSKGNPPGLIGWYPQNAVTFIDNHDTGSTQRHWCFPDGKVEMGYAYIITHPGIPCLFMDHIYDFKLMDKIQTLLNIRLRNRVNAKSKVVVQKAESNIYVAKIDDRIILKLGSRVDMDDLLPDKSIWKVVASGVEYCIWESMEPLAPLPLLKEVEAVEPQGGMLQPFQPTQPIRLTRKMSEGTRKRILEEVPELVKPNDDAKKKKKSNRQLLKCF